MIIGLGDQDSGDDRADDRRKSHRCRCQACDDHDEQTGCEEQFRAFRPRRLREETGKENSAENEHRRDDGGAGKEDVHHVGEAGKADMGRQGTKREDDRHDRQILEQQHRQSRSSDRGRSVGQWKDQGRRRQSERQSECDRGSQARAE